MSKPKSKAITKWNLLALAVLLVGGGLVLALDQLWLSSWANSGLAFPISQRLTVELPKGKSLVYYESYQAVPSGDATLYIVDPDGERVRPKTPAADISYRLIMQGKSGRALWQLDLPQAGLYTFTCFNHNYADDRDIPPSDRVVFLKQPDSLAQVSVARTGLQVTGATVVVGAAVACYILHARTLAKRRRSLPAAAA